MLTRYLTLTVLMATLCTITALSIFSGCQSMAPMYSRPVLDKNWGKSYESAKNHQILNPRAGEDLSPVAGFDGEAAQNNTKKYEEGFKEKPPKQVYNLNIGNIGGGQK